ncbi:TerC/Alx family metal homeostasis membrane protein [Candidatus Saccharibacteria bacterium]|nr:TerC/Alx family metal homeostasis membrane protein [Candidatus Saccharibacteria bacterium]
MNLASTAPVAEHVRLDIPGWHWAVLIGWFVFLLLLDLLVFHRKDHAPKMKESIVQTIIWVGLGIGLGVLMWPLYGGQAAAEYFSGFAIEKSLSIDNVFVWSIILSYFRVPAKYQHRVLFWGIFGALIFRALFIFLGVAILDRFEFALILLGLLLLWTGYKIFGGGSDEFNPKTSRMIKFLRKFIHITHETHGHALFIREGTKRVATVLFLALCAIELTDILFAIDSVPAILAVARDPFIVFASNAAAILGLRALYFVFHGMKERFWLLNRGLGIILVGVGVKMLVSVDSVFGIDWIGYHVPTSLSLTFILSILLMSITASFYIPNPETKGKIS